MLTMDDKGKRVLMYDDLQGKWFNLGGILESLDNIGIFVRVGGSLIHFEYPCNNIRVIDEHNIVEGDGTRENPYKVDYNDSE